MAIHASFPILAALLAVGCAPAAVVETHPGHDLPPPVQAAPPAEAARPGPVHTPPALNVGIDAPRFSPPVGPGAEPLVALRPYTELQADYDLGGTERSRLAKVHKQAVVEELFARAGLSFPPAQLLLRAYKAEAELEVWAASAVGGAMTHVTTYGICAASGDLGPKRREGDRQVPEGFYTIQYLWPNSDYYLSMKVGYPNVSDKILGDPRMPGSDIMIHGNCASIGCLAMSDERIEELWVMGMAANERSRIAVHVFPARDRATLAEHPKYEAHRGFWDNIYQGHDMFAADKRLPRVSVERDGRYSFKPAE